MAKKAPTPDDLALAQRILKLRKDVLNIDSQEEFAAKLGDVTRGAVGNWERVGGVKRENLRRIAEVFRVSFDWLATGRGDPLSSAPPKDSIDRMLDEFPPEFADEADLLREELKMRVRSTLDLVERTRRH